MARKSQLFEAVLASAAKLREIVPDMVLVGGTAAAIHAGHRESMDHDHVLSDLIERYAEVTDAVEASAGWATSVRASHPPLTLMGEMDVVRGGIRQLRRSRPLEVELYDLGADKAIRVPTLPEILRIKAYLTIERGAARDFLDVAALSEVLGTDTAALILQDIDDYYAVRSNEEAAVSTHLALALSTPHPVDSPSAPDLSQFLGISDCWSEWDAVVSQCQAIAKKLAVL